MAVVTAEIARALAELTWQTKSCSRECLDVALQFPDENWDWEMICHMITEYKIDTFDAEFVIKHIDKPWEWQKMSHTHTSLDMFKVIERFPHVSVCVHWGGLSRNKHLNAAILEKYDSKPWNFEAMSHNRKLTLEMVRLKPVAVWDWWSVSSSPSISLKEILANPDLPWNWKRVSANASISYEEAALHPEVEWNWIVLVFQKKGGVRGFIEYHTRDAAARRIQAQWRKCISDPAYLACRRRLEREFNNML